MPFVDEVLFIPFDFHEVLETDVEHVFLSAVDIDPSYVAILATRNKQSPLRQSLSQGLVVHRNRRLTALNRELEPTKQPPYHVEKLYDSDALARWPAERDQQG